MSPLASVLAELRQIRRSLERALDATYDTDAPHIRHLRLFDLRREVHAACAALARQTGDEPHRVRCVECGDDGVVNGFDDCPTCGGRTEEAR